MKILKSGGKLHWAKNLFLRLKYKAGCCDIYSLDYYLARKIIGPLKEFRRNMGKSYPSDLTPEEWEKIVDEMIWAFEYFLDGEGLDDDFCFPQIKKDYKREQKGFELFGKYFHNLWF